jgi:hypothetical protein
MNKCKISGYLIDSFECNTKYADFKFDKMIEPTKKDPLKVRTQVFRITTEKKPYKLVVKISRIPYTTESQKLRYKKRLYAEMKYSIEMSDENIGPKIYDYFYLDYSYNGIKYINQFIIMESMTIDATKALEDPKISNSDKIKIIDTMIKLLKKQIKYGLYCSDIKPDNYTVNIEDNVVKSIKMIDFGENFCKKKIGTTLQNNERALIFQLLLFVYVDTHDAFKIYTETNTFKKFTKDCRDNVKCLEETLEIELYRDQLIHYFRNSEIKAFGLYIMKK